ncbi:MAG TPA: pyridoxal-phosphate dependent enzyme [Candidatus Saccharimonadales bacterium]|nr:pyridoxal-phosphate dependent enzyme [Candidatus Saccharimonadales bacterium]
MKKIIKNKIVSNFSKRIFAGNDAKKEYINPANHSITPLIEIVDETLNPFKKDNVRIFAKDLRLPPLDQVKAGTMYQMYSDANKKTDLSDIETFYEATSGNTGSALALFANQSTVVYVNSSTPNEKIRILQLFGAQVVVAGNGIELARKNGSKKTAYNLDQYDNQSNPLFFEKNIGPQIWEQTDGSITLFCTGLGTTGTIIGINRYLKRKNAKIKTVGVIVKEGDSVPGVRTLKRLEEVSLPWQENVDETYIAGAQESYELSLRLIRDTMIMAGPSSGFSLAGLLQELTNVKKKNMLEELRNDSGEVVAVFPILDGPWLYINDYFKILGTSFFKDVKKE